MSAELIAILLEKYGPPAISFVAALIAKIEAGGTVSSAEWASLTSSLNQTATDHMLSVLKAAGIDPTSPQGITMLSLAK